MSKKRTSGQGGFVFANCEDLRNLPDAAEVFEEKLHGGFAVDKREGFGEIYYGMPGCGLLKISNDLTTQELIELPKDIRGMNFHSTKIGCFDGKVRLFMPANNDEKVVIMTLQGDVDFILPKPEFKQYMDKENTFKPTDTILNGDNLLISDGYGLNYISTVDLKTRNWTKVFGGKTDDYKLHDKFGTAHGVNRTPMENRLIIADRPNSRLEVYTFQGGYQKTYFLEKGSRPCGIDYINWHNHWYAAVGSLDDPVKRRPAPIYILDGITHEVISTVRAKEELGIERADHIHNVVWHEFQGNLFLVCQSWNPGRYFVLELIE